MAAQPRLSDNSSDCSTEIFLENGSVNKKEIVTHNKLSILKADIKIDLETKHSLSSNGNMIWVSSLHQKWLDLVQKLCSTST